MKYSILFLQEKLSELDDLDGYLDYKSGKVIDVLPQMKIEINKAISILKECNKTEPQNDS